MSLTLLSDSLTQVRAALANVGRLAAAAGEEGLEKLANDVMRESQARAPEDTGNLVSAHRVSKDVTVRATLKRFNVYVDDVQAPYAIFMHEGMITGMKYNLGPRSEAKSGYVSYHYGKGVGWKFLQRAADAVKRDALRQLGDGIGRVLR